MAPNTIPLGKKATNQNQKDDTGGKEGNSRDRSPKLCILTKQKHFYENTYYIS